MCIHLLREAVSPFQILQVRSPCIPVKEKNALSSHESRLLGDKWCCQRRRCRYTTFLFGIQTGVKPWKTFYMLILLQ